jgi:catechol 2,3-dioxygenase-like lactoylglutathione lyase family enzyme
MTSGERPGQPGVWHWRDTSFELTGRFISRRLGAGGIVRIIGIEHVQLTMPRGEEDRARKFYSGILGIPEVPKPAELAMRGGVWFENKYLKIHLGVEAEFRPACKAHPALLVEDLHALMVLLRERGIPVVDDDALEGFFRVYVSDPFGNRIELVEPLK